MHSFRLFLLAMAATLVLGYMMVKWSVEWGFIDIPDSRKVHAHPTPRTGGLAMFGGCTVALLAASAAGWCTLPNLPWQTWLAGLGFVTMGGLDDRFNFHPRQKFLILLALSALAAWPWIPVAYAYWAIQTSRVSFIMYPLIAVVLTFWFMAVPNAVNIEDAINGYMGGYTFIVLVGLSLQGFAGWLPQGALAAFLLFNWPKAKHFMGDAGSFGCGFLLAESILRGGGMAHPLVALALTAPISMDVAMGLIRRRRLGVSFFEADKATFPHHVLELMRGSALLAAPILWLNVLGFVVFSHNWKWVVVQASGYAIVLVLLNRSHLFRKSPKNA